jgi:hypothetical protein
MAVQIVDIVTVRERWLESRVLGPQREQETAGCRRLHDAELQDVLRDKYCYCVWFGYVGETGDAVTCGMEVECTGVW